jgi:GT2 family glycosyltransferase
MKIIFCLTGNNFSGNFVDCYGETIHYAIKKGWDFAVSRKESSSVFHVRSAVLGADVLRGKKQKPFNNSIHYDWLIWIDSDIVWNPQQIEDLINTKGDIVSGLYVMSNNIHFTAVEDYDYRYFRKNGTFDFLSREDLKKDKYKQPFPVEYVGMGFMAVRRGVFENLDYPWFKPKNFDLGEDIVDFSSEDVGFCLRAKNKGFSIIVNPNIIVGHEKKVVL